MSGAKRQNMVERTNSTIEANNNGRLPYLSLSGPKKICPAANPIILVVSPICTIGRLAEK